MAQSSPNVPVSALSSFVGARPYPALAIGKSFVVYNGPQNVGSYWWVAVDLTTLNAVQNIATQDGLHVPPQIQQLLGNTQYFLFFMTAWQSTMNLMGGAIYAFLQQVGAGPQLARAEQLISQLGTGSILNFSYVLAATFDANDVPGYEAFSSQGYSTLTMQFMPITIGGKTIYAPVNLP